jgi:hypothetical protein
VTPAGIVHVHPFPVITFTYLIVETVNVETVQSAALADGALRVEANKSEIMAVQNQRNEKFFGIFTLWII